MVTIDGTAYLNASGQVTAIARERAHVNASEDARVIGFGQSKLVVRGSVTVTASDTCEVHACRDLDAPLSVGSPSITASDHAKVKAQGEGVVVHAHGHAVIEVADQAHAIVSGDASVLVHDGATGVVDDQVRATVRGTGSLRARGHTQVSGFDDGEIVGTEHASIVATDHVRLRVADHVTVRQEGAVHTIADGCVTITADGEGFVQHGAHDTLASITGNVRVQRLAFARDGRVQSEAPGSAGVPSRIHPSTSVPAPTAVGVAAV